MFCLLFKCVFLCEHFICGNEMVLIKQLRSLLLYMWHDIWNLSSVKCLWKSYQRRCTFVPTHLRFDLFRRHMTVAKKKLTYVWYSWCLYFCHMVHTHPMKFTQNEWFTNLSFQPIGIRHEFKWKKNERNFIDLNFYYKFSSRWKKYFDINLKFNANSYNFLIRIRG